MNLKQLTLENFKCFKSKIEIEFGKITLLTGANSSGKSSIIYSIIGALQSGEFPFQFSTNGKYVNMGDFREVVFNHEKEKEIQLHYTFENGTLHKVETVWKENKENNLPKLFRLSAKAENFSITIETEGEKHIVSDFNYHSEQPASNNFITNQIDPYGLESLIIPPSKDPILVLEVIKTLTNLFNSYEENLNFIGSFRLHPDRSYFETSKTDLKVNPDGKGYLDQILLWERKKSEKFKALVNILKDLNLLYAIKPNRIKGGKYDILIKSKPNKESVLTSLYDVGFGVSQFLPIIVADLQLQYGSTLFMAQPEIHLHPSIQSAFANYLINEVKVKGKNYVIETHSEYLLNKIRLGIVKGEIEENDVKIIFVDNDAVTHKITFNKKGQILNAPDNFFKTYMIDVMEIALNAKI